MPAQHSHELGFALLDRFVRAGSGLCWAFHAVGNDKILLQIDDIIFLGRLEVLDNTLG